MSECKTTVEKILKIDVHPNADRLELVTCRGWQCVVPKGVYKEGDLCVYIPIDSILPEALESLLFGGTTIKLTKSRVKTIKLRGAISQGLIANLVTIENHLGKKLKENQDITEKLGITKFEPPAPKFQNFASGKKGTIKQTNPNFSKYTSLQNIKNYPDLFDPEETVICTEKIHGTNFRAGWVPFVADTFMKKVKKFFGFAPKWEFVYGSHNVQLQNRGKHSQTFYDTNVYYKTCVQYNLKEVIPKGIVIFGEIYGEGIQKNYSYGLKGETKLSVFDVQEVDENGKKEYRNLIDGLNIANQLGLPIVPILLICQFKDLVPEELFKGTSELSDQQKVESVEEKDCYMGRKKLKVINPEYLLQKGNTDYH
jgi:RNA ligase (TIGR02306 family)